MTTAEQVASWAQQAREATARRDEMIRAMRAEGATLRAIAAVAKMSKDGVQRVIDRG